MVRYILPLNRFCVTLTACPLPECWVRVVLFGGVLLPPRPRHPCTLRESRNSRAQVNQGEMFFFLIASGPPSNLHRLRRLKYDGEKQIEQAVDARCIIASAE